MVGEVAAVIDVEESTVYDWIRRWEEERDVKDKPKSDRPEKVTEDDEKEIKRHIGENDPKKYGINASSFTTKELQIYFAKYRGKIVYE